MFLWHIQKDYQRIFSHYLAWMHQLTKSRSLDRLRNLVLLAYLQLSQAINSLRSKCRH